jgi:hypothetical protein
MQKAPQEGPLYETVVYSTATPWITSLELSVRLVTDDLSSSHSQGLIKREKKRLRTQQKDSGNNLIRYVPDGILRVVVNGAT